MSGPTTSAPVYDNTGAFQYEEESPYEEPPEHLPQQYRLQRVHQQGLGTSVPQLPARDGKRRAFPPDEGDVDYIKRESSPPLVLVTDPSSHETNLSKLLETYNNACQDAFAYITFPFTCLIIFLHHVLRFILRGIVRPLVVDTGLMVVEYIIRPLMNIMIQPLFNSMLGGAISFIDLLLILIKPVVALFRSIRLVEINYVKNGSIQEV